MSIPTEEEFVKPGMIFVHKNMRRIETIISVELPTSGNGRLCVLFADGKIRSYGKEDNLHEGWFYVWYWNRLFEQL